MVEISNRTVESEQQAVLISNKRRQIWTLIFCNHPIKLKSDIHPTCEQHVWSFGYTIIEIIGQQSFVYKIKAIFPEAGGNPPPLYPI